MNKKIFNFNKDELSDLYISKGLTLKEIGEIFNCSDGTIRKYILNFGIKLRKPAHLGQTDRAKEKISKSNRGLKRTKAQRFNCGKANRGKKGKDTTAWKGGTTSDGHGYILIKKHGHPKSDKQGYVKEQILIMEKKIGRYLKKNEVVHHVNRKRDDNRIENLMLFSSQSKHIEYHNKFDPINR